MCWASIIRCHHPAGGRGGSVGPCRRALGRHEQACAGGKRTFGPCSRPAAGWLQDQFRRTASTCQQHKRCWAIIVVQHNLLLSLMGWLQSAVYMQGVFEFCFSLLYVSWASSVQKWTWRISGLLQYAPRCDTKPQCTHNPCHHWVSHRQAVPQAHAHVCTHMPDQSSCMTGQELWGRWLCRSALKSSIQQQQERAGSAIHPVQA